MWQDITDILTEEGVKKIKAGQVLMFDYEGSPVHLKIKRKAKGKVWAESTYLYKPDEVDIVDAES